jgi:hypothetical protein
MLVFLDTEFTDFVQIELISIALVSEDGREFYAERTDFRRDDCSEFVRLAVLPVLGRVSDSACTQKQLTERLRFWFDTLPEPAILIFDYSSDWELLVDALQGEDSMPTLSNVDGQLLLAAEIISSLVYQKALNTTFSPEWPRHHALADARAMRAGFGAWRKENPSYFRNPD